MGRFWLFATSLSPALVIVSIRLIPKFGCYAWLGILVGVIFFIGSYYLVIGRKNVGGRDITPESVTKETMQVPTYLITFVFPFLFMSDTPSLYTLIAYGVFAIFLLLLLFRTDLAVVNPALLIAGYHIFTVETDAESIYVISRKPPRVKTTLHVHSVLGDLHLSTAR